MQQCSFYPPPNLFPGMHHVIASPLDLITAPMSLESPHLPVAQHASAEHALTPAHRHPNGCCSCRRLPPVSTSFGLTFFSPGRCHEWHSATMMGLMMPCASGSWRKTIYPTPRSSRATPASPLSSDPETSRPTIPCHSRAAPPVSLAEPRMPHSSQTLSSCSYGSRYCTR